MASESYDFIVVGGGLAGLVVASRLSEDPNTQVLVIEAGEDQTADPKVTVPGMWPSLIRTTSTWNFKTVPQEGLGGRELHSPQGHLLGGSSALNGLSFTAPSKATIDAWAALGNPGWDWPSFSKSLENSFTFTLSPGNTKGNGPLQVALPTEDNNWPVVWRETLANLGYPAAKSANLVSGQIHGSHTVPDSIHPETKQRSFSANAYLEPAKSRGNITVLTRATVNKIILEKSSDIVATGVQYTTTETGTEIVNARREVILAAGTMNSPRLLELSGIGDANLLSSLGIEVVIDNPHVGENLQNHPVCGVSYEISEKEGLETTDKLSRQDPSALATAFEAYSKQSGPLSKSGTNSAAQLPLPQLRTEAGRNEMNENLKLLDEPGSWGRTTKEFAKAHSSFIRSILTSPEEASGCYIFIPGYASSEADGTMTTAPEGSESYCTIALVLNHPLSRGSVHISSLTATPSSTDISIDPKYLTHPLDVEVLSRHLQFLEAIISAAPLAHQLKPGGKRNPGAPPKGGFADLDKARKYVRDTSMGAAHYTGTCSMMPRETGGVVDPSLRVYGTKNLRVCDASIIPIAPRMNSQATVYGVAEHAAKIIRSGL